MYRRKKAFWLPEESVQRFCAEVVRAPTACAPAVQEPLKGDAAVGVAPTGVVASLPESAPALPAQRPSLAVPATIVPVLDGMESLGSEVDLREAFADFTVMTAPLGAFVVTLVQMWGML